MAAEVVGPEPSPDPGPLEDNVFVNDGDSAFVATSDDAESTFGLDVDTGSFTVGRMFLDGGYLPDPASIRPEEWINAVEHDDPEPTNGDLGLTVESGPAPGADDGSTLVRIGVSTRDVPALERPPANLTFVIDTSGSMDIRERLGLVKSSLALLVQHLRPTIRSPSSSTATTPDRYSPRHRSAPPRPSSTPSTSSGLAGTNMEAGLRTGYEQRRRGRSVRGAADRRRGRRPAARSGDGLAGAGRRAPREGIGEVRLRWESTASGAVAESAATIPAPSTDRPPSPPTWPPPMSPVRMSWPS